MVWTGILDSSTDLHDIDKGSAAVAMNPDFSHSKMWLPPVSLRMDDNANSHRAHLNEEEKRFKILIDSRCCASENRIR
ncbi:hypothetical protein TNCV_5120301 [Trichonephila clavipes]|nr:hypothetical protein TNCV_5120301 [Trichonephila clavipes]